MPKASPTPWSTGTHGKTSSRGRWRLSRPTSSTAGSSPTRQLSLPTRSEHMEYKYAGDGGYYPHESTVSIPSYASHIEASIFADKFLKLLSDDLQHDVTFSNTLPG